MQSQTDVRLEVIPLIRNDPEALKALKVLQNKGYTSDEVREAYEELQPVPVTRVRERQAKRASLDMRVRTEAARNHTAPFDRSRDLVESYTVSPLRLCVDGVSSLADKAPGRSCLSAGARVH